MAVEVSKDNQWWYGQSSHRSRVEGQSFAVIQIGGRACAMEHSEVGRDGRPTHSFKFLHQADRAYWQSLNRQRVEVELLQTGSHLPDVDFACGDDDDDGEAPETEVVYGVIATPRPIRRTTPTAFDEIDFPSADEGTPQCVFFGDCWTEDWMVLTVGKYRTTPIKSSGGK